MLEVGCRKWEVGGWKLEVGSWKLEVGSWTNVKSRVNVPLSKGDTGGSSKC